MYSSAWQKKNTKQVPCFCKSLLLFVCKCYALVLVQIRAAIKKQSAGKYSAKVKARGKRREHVAAHPIPKDELGDVFK